VGLEDRLQGNHRVVAGHQAARRRLRRAPAGTVERQEILEEDMSPFMQLRALLGALALLAVVVGSTPVSAQQPASVNPTAAAVKEEQLLQQLQQVQGRVSIPDTKAATLIQPAGQSWREFHQVTLPWIGTVAILGVLALIVVFYLARGMIRMKGGRSGRTIVRFNAFERFVHWMTASCFVVLALTGLNVTFGRAVLMPVMGAESFAAWSQWAKYAHNYLSFPFTVGVVLIFLMWIASNIPSSVDVEWVKRGGGLVSGEDPPAGRFNGGQKVIYWIVVLGGGAAAVTGYMLMFPFYATDLAGMQLAQVIHGTVAVLFVAAMLAHIYVGTIGMEGAFEAMGTGNVDVNWAKQHHSLWVEGSSQPESGASQRPYATPAE
jgi:formate dehydrogenase subunit gamma